MVYVNFVQNYRKHASRLSVSEAYIYIRSHGLTSKEILNMSYSDDVAESNWYAAIFQYMHTRDKRLCLYDRCLCEKKMRKHWSAFQQHFIYVEPVVPPLPPITP